MTMLELSATMMRPKARRQRLGSLPMMPKRAPGVQNFQKIS